MFEQEGILTVVWLIVLVLVITHL